MNNPLLRTSYKCRLSSITVLATFSLLIVFVLMPSVLIAQEDSWLDSMKKAKGMSVGSLEPRYGGLGGHTKTDATEKTGIDSGRREDGTPGREVATDPKSLDPNSPDVAAKIREWISVARPPEDAVEGNDVHYSGKGNVIGTVAGGIIESRHETGAIDPVFLWINRRFLDSIDHCTMEEYVVAYLKSESIGHCSGRYGAVKDLKGMRLAEAKSAVTAAGFQYSLAPGSPAKTLEQQGAVERQEPGPDKYLQKGQTIKLTVHSQHVDLCKVPGVVGLSAEEAKSRVADARLKTVIQPGGRPSSHEQAGKVERQNPESGNSVLAGSEISLYIYGPFIDGQYIPSREELIAQTDCSRFPGSRALWDDSAGKPMCGCSGGLQWNLARSQCVPADVHANELCTRDFPGSIARGRTADGKINCDCPDGYFWNVAHTGCEKLIPPQELCSRDFPGSVPTGRDASGRVNCDCPNGYFWNVAHTGCEKLIPPQELCTRDFPGSIARGRTADGKINCDCPDGYFWNVAHTGCEKLIPPQELCSRDFPGSVPTGRDAGGRVNCDCPQGYVWVDNPRRCIEGRGDGRDRDWRNWDRDQQCEFKISQIRNFMELYRMNSQNTLQKQTAENIAREAAVLGCDQNKINQALGRGAGGDPDSTADDCPCIDEQGRRYREAFGQKCGSGATALRDYNCSGSGTTTGMVHPQTGSGEKRRNTCHDLAGRWANQGNIVEFATRDGVNYDGKIITVNNQWQRYGLRPNQMIYRVQRTKETQYKGQALFRKPIALVIGAQAMCGVMEFWLEGQLPHETWFRQQ